MFIIMILLFVFVILFLVPLPNRISAELLYFREIALPGKPEDIEGDNIVGSFWQGKQVGYFSKNGTTTILDAPGSNGTFASGVSGNLVVGTAYFNTGSRGFIYDGVGYTFIDRGNIPGRGTAKNLEFTAISGSKIVGHASGLKEYPNESYLGSFVYENGSFTDVYAPYQGSQIATSSGSAWGIDGDTFLGGRWLGSSNVYFTKNLITGIYSEIAPLGAESNGTIAGISGGNVLLFKDFYDGSKTFTRGYLGNAENDYEMVFSTQPANSLLNPNTGYDFPVANASEVEITGIDGTTVVGSYKESGVTKFFMASVPEPSSISLILAGVPVMMAGRRRRG